MRLRVGSRGRGWGEVGGTSRDDALEGGESAGNRQPARWQSGRIAQIHQAFLCCPHGQANGDGCRTSRPRSGRWWWRCRSVVTVGSCGAITLLFCGRRSRSGRGRFGLRQTRFGLGHGHRERTCMPPQTTRAISRRVVNGLETAVAHGVGKNGAVDSHTFEPTPRFRFARFERYQLQPRRLEANHVDDLLLVHHATHSLALCVVDELKNKRKRNHKHKRWRRFGGHSRHGIKVICLNKNLVSFKKILHSVDTTRMTTNVHCVSKRNEEHGRPADVKFPSLGQSAPFLLPSPLYFPLSPPCFSIRHPNPPSLTKRSKRERSEERTQKRRPPTCLTTHPL